MRLLSVFLLVVLMFVYASLGGVIFHYIEIDHEIEVKKNLNSSLYGKIGECVTYNDLVALKNLNTYMFSSGVFVKRDTTVVRYPFWDYRSSILASIDSLTLVGNPAFSARTIGGRVFSIFYVLIGQFYFYIAYLLCGRLIFGLLSRIWRFCRNSFCQTHLGIEKLIKYIILATIGLVIFLAIPASIFSKIEKWEYGRSFYFVFATLLSIGFYDIPSLNPNLDFDNETMQWYRLCYGFWLLTTYFWFGGILLAYFVFIVGLVENEVEAVCDHIADDINNIKNKMRPQIPAPVYPGYIMQQPNIGYNGHITNVVVP